MSKYRTKDPEWSPLPNQTQPSYIPIVRAPTHGRLHLVALGDEIEGIFTHFYLGRTIPCFGRDNGCLCGQVIMPRRWHGYIAAFDPLIGKSVIAEVTRDAVRTCQKTWDMTFEGIRGKAFVLYRTGRAGNGPVRIELAELDSRITALPAAFHLREALMRLWGYTCEGQ